MGSAWQGLTFTTGYAHVPQNQYSWHRYVASWCLLMAPLQEDPKLKPYQNHKNYESTLQLWMLWCPWHQSIHSCRVDPCGTPKYESKFKIFKMIKKYIFEAFCAAYVESYTFRPVLNCVWWRCLCPTPQLKEGDRHRNDFNKKKSQKKKDSSEKLLCLSKICSDIFYLYWLWFYILCRF